MRSIFMEQLHFDDTPVSSQNKYDKTYIHIYVYISMSMDKTDMYLRGYSLHRSLILFVCNSHDHS